MPRRRPRGRRHGTSLLVALAIAGIVGAMIAAGVLIGASQWLGDASQRTAQDASSPSFARLNIDSAYIKAEPEGAHLQLVLRSGIGDSIPIANTTFLFDTEPPLVATSGDGMTWTALRDADGSLARKHPHLASGDLLEVQIALPEHNPTGAVTLTVEAEGAVVGDARLVLPPIPSGRALVPVPLA